MNLTTAFRWIVTLAMLALAAVAASLLWRHYLHAPWTRDGRVRAEVINLAPDVSGLVAEVRVHDNQYVQRGELLMRIDAERYRLTLARAEASLDAARAELAQRKREAARRAHLDSFVVSAENRDSANTQADAAAAQVEAALAARELARLDLQRTEIHAPTDGYITNLNLHPGDFAAAGHAAMALIDSHSFWVNGYFEETKLPHLHEGDTVDIELMNGGHLSGHIGSLSRGITDRDNATGTQLLANVNPTFSWVRLAQRIPVRIELDAVPAHVTLVAGLTCTVVVHDDSAHRVAAPSHTATAPPS